MIETAENIIDVTDQIDCLKAEQRGKDVLILRRLTDPIRRFDGKTARYELEYRWLSDKRYLVCVLGNEFSYWQWHEIKGWQAKSLFEMFRLFP
jgi:hypothetical protein